MNRIDRGRDVVARKTPRQKRQRQDRQPAHPPMCNQRDRRHQNKSKSLRTPERQHARQQRHREPLPPLVGEKRQHEQRGEWNFSQLAEGVQKENRLGQQKDEDQCRPAISLPPRDPIRHGGHDHRQHQTGQPCIMPAIFNRPDACRQRIGQRAEGPPPHTDKVMMLSK